MTTRRLPYCSAVVLPLVLSLSLSLVPLATQGSSVAAGPLSTPTATTWTRQFGSSGYDYASGVAVDGAGNSYLAGYTYGALPGQTSSGSDDAFIRKYDPTGNELWTRQFGGSGDDHAWGVAVDGAGNSYLAGDTWGALPGQTSSGSADAFMRKYDPSGNVLWTGQFG
ncbi:MAG: SBBP repeat-containing protein, partial [Chloroflexi bacterium]|nr:SBBP repeat-containing protein [Chloroflexota bacterium]